MNRAGERGKGATSARQLSGPRLGQPGGWGQSWAASAANRCPAEKRRARYPEKSFSTRGRGVVETLERPKAGNRCPSHRRIFSVICGYSDAGWPGTATPSHARQAGAARCYAFLPDRGELIAPAQQHRQEGRMRVRTEGTVRTTYQAGRISADLAAGACSHWPAREVGTAGTEKRGGKEGQNPRALVASPACPPAGVAVP